MPEWIPLSDPCFKNPPAHRAQVLSEEVAPSPPTPARPTMCSIALGGLDRALDTWVNQLGFDVAAYRIGTRSLTRRSELEAYNALSHAIAFVRRACGPGALPPELADMAGGSAARRVIPSDV
jgi:hypothetical protein